MEVYVFGLGLFFSGIIFVIGLLIIIGLQLQLVIRLLDDLVDRTPLDHVGFIGQRRKRK